MKYSAIIIALIAFVNSSYSQVFNGKLIDELTNEPIIGATVQVKNKEYKFLTNSDGVIRFEANFKESDTLVFSFFGYENLSVKYIILKNLKI